ncbi:MAG: hypothetical protein KIS88_07120 [Anaerolineales bacterium]|nr:hypothetical protein [Anaerolineales bacterium]
MHNSILSSPFISAGLLLVIGLLNVYLTGHLNKVRRALPVNLIDSEDREEIGEQRRKKLLYYVFFQALLVFGVHFLLLSSFYSDQGMSELFSFVYGIALIPILQVVLENLASIRTWTHTRSHPKSVVSGKINANEWFARSSAANSSFFSHSLLSLFLFGLTGSPILLGGSFGGFVLALANQRSANSNPKANIEKAPPTTPRRVTVLLILTGLLILFWIVWILVVGHLSAGSLLALLWVGASLVLARGLGAPERWGRWAANLFAVGVAAHYWIDRWISGELHTSDIGVPLTATVAGLLVIHFMLKGKRMDSYFQRQLPTKRAKS